MLRLFSKEAWRTNSFSCLCLISLYTSCLFSWSRSSASLILGPSLPRKFLLHSDTPEAGFFSCWLLCVVLCSVCVFFPHYPIGPLRANTGSVPTSLPQPWTHVSQPLLLQCEWHWFTAGVGQGLATTKRINSRKLGYHILQNLMLSKYHIF